jgi:hypothetical protein
MPNPLSDWTLRLEPIARSSKVVIDVCDGSGRVRWSLCRDLRDEDGRKKASEDIGAKFELNSAEILELLTTRWNLYRDWQIAAAESAAEVDPPEAAVNYDDSQGFLCWHHATMHGEIPVPLANFTARIVEQLVRDDGTERSTTFIMEGKLADGRSLPRGEVTADQFSAMRWPVRLWGSRAVTHAGHNLADHARAAIQLLSGDPPTRVLYTHTGWRQIGDSWFYLHQGGAIGPQGVQPGIDVALPDALSGYDLPHPPEGPELVKAIRASFGMLAGLAADRVAFPVLAAVYRACLGSCDFAPHLHGPTGVFKTEIVALAGQHYGVELDARHLPASWSSTGNSLEALAHAAKDTLLIVDDFAPHGSTSDIQRFHREADRLLRAQGNRSGRGRMRPDGTLRAAKPPRGMILSTGEDLPRGQSLRSRLFSLELSPGDIDATRLTECQRDAMAGLYAQSMAAFIRWLAAQIGDVRNRLSQERARLRERAGASGQHARTPGIAADLFLGLSYFLEFARASGAITDSERDALNQRGRRALLEAAASQSQHIEDADSVNMFVRFLVAAISSRRCHLAGPDGGEPRNPRGWGWFEEVYHTRDGTRTRWVCQGRRIGWVEGDDLFLEPECAHAEAQRLAAEQGAALPLSAQALRRRLKERGLLVSTEPDKLTTRRVLEGQRRTVIHLHSGSLYLQQQGESRESGQQWANPVGSTPGSPPGSNASESKPGERPGEKSPEKTASAPIPPVDSREEYIAAETDGDSELL